MPTLSSGAEQLRTIAEQLAPKEQAAGVEPTTGAFRGPKYLGFGHVGVTGVGIYGRGHVRTGRHEPISHEIHFDLLSHPDEQGIRQNAGHFGLLLFRDGAILPSVHGFDPNHVPHVTPTEAIAAPLGEWAMRTIRSGIERDKARREGTGSLALGTDPVTPSAQDMAPITEFLAHPGNDNTIFSFHYGSDKLALGLKTLSVPSAVELR